MDKFELPKDEVIGEHPFQEEYSVFAGASKYLELSWFEDSKQFMLFAKSIPGMTRVPGETTDLFKKTLEKVRDKANKIGSPVTLILDPVVPVMETWCRTKAAEAVGDWDSIDGRIFKKIFYPSQQK